MKNRIIAVITTCVLLITSLSFNAFAIRMISNEIIQKSDNENKVIFQYEKDYDFDLDKLIIVLFKCYSNDIPDNSYLKEYLPSGISIDEAILINQSQIDKRDFHAVYLLNIDSPSKEQTILAAELLSQHPSIMSVELNYRNYFEHCTAPVDYYYLQDDYPYDVIHAEDAWYVAGNAPAEVNVAVIDSGVSIHDDLEYNIDRVHEWDFIDEEKDTSDNGLSNYHGTHVSGIIGAVWNNIGIAGIHKNVNIIPFACDSTLGMELALEQCELDDIKIVNISMGHYNNPSNSIQTILNNFDGIVVCAAGNNGIDLDNSNYKMYPACYNCDCIISVGSFASSLYINSTSNYGVESVDILAPGLRIMSTVGTSSYMTDSGTSMAAPFVTGTAALLKSTYPSATYPEIIRAIEDGAISTSASTSYVKYGFLNMPNCFSVLQNIITSRRTIEDGYYYIATYSNPMKVLDIYGQSQLEEEDIVVNSYNGSNSQKYYFEYCNGDYGYDYYKIQNCNSSYYLSSENVGVIGESVIQYEWENYEDQKWRLLNNGDGTYKLENLIHHTYADYIYSCPSNNQTVYLESNSNETNQKFILIPITEYNIEGTYQLILQDNQTKALSVNSSLLDGSNLVVDVADDEDFSQLFYLVNTCGLYKLISLYSGKALSFSNSQEIVQKNIAINDVKQFWHLCSSSQSNQNLVEIQSIMNNCSILIDNANNSNVILSDATASMFSLNKVDFYEDSFLGEFVSYTNSNLDIKNNNNQAVFSTINSNGRNTLQLNKDEEGLWSIIDRNTSKSLTITGNSITFDSNDLSLSQKWLLTPVGSERVMINLDCGLVLKNNNDLLSINNYSNSNSERFVVHIKGDVTNDFVISSADILLIRRNISGLEDFDDIQEYCADVNEDGDITMLDVLYLRQIVYGLDNINAPDLNDYSQ